MAEEIYKEEKTFEGDYLVIDLIDEYGAAYTGKEKFAVATDLSEEELLETYGQELEPYTPFLMITRQMYAAFRKTNTNDERERKRESLYHDAFALDSGTPPVEKQLDTTSRCESGQVMECLLKKMRGLPRTIGPRLYKRYILGLTTEEIAKQEGKQVRTVQASLQRGRAAMLKAFEECGVVS